LALAHYRADRAHWNVSEFASEERFARRWRCSPKEVGAIARKRACRDSSVRAANGSTRASPRRSFISGPYSDEGPTIERLHEFIRESGYTFDGQREKHHELYLGDPRRTAPEKLRTIIRQPVAET
jgi:hypothetical protein